MRRRTSWITVFQSWYHRYNLPTPIPSLAAFSFFAFHRRIQRDVQAGTIYWRPELRQLMLLHTRRLPLDFLSRERWSLLGHRGNFTSVLISNGIHLPMFMTSPNTDEELVVEQFQRSFSNCFWHSEIPRLAPCLNVGIRSGLFSQTFLCCEDKSGTPPHVVKLPLLRVLSAEIPIHLETRQEVKHEQARSKPRKDDVPIKFVTLLFLISMKTKYTKRKKKILTSSWQWFGLGTSLTTKYRPLSTASS